MSNLTLPLLPPVPVMPLTADEKTHIFNSLIAIDKARDLWRPEVQEYVKQAYIRIWLSLCLDIKVSPLLAASTSASCFQTVLPRFLSAIEKLGLHTRKSVAEWHVNRIAAEASAAWQDATIKAQARTSEPAARPAY